MIQNNSDENRKEYEQGRKETLAVLRREKRLYMKKLIATVEENRQNPRRFFERSGRTKEVFKPQTNMMINETKEIVTDQKEIVEMFKTNVENFLNIPECMPDDREDIMITENLI